LAGLQAQIATRLLAAWQRPFPSEPIGRRPDDGYTSLGLSTASVIGDKHTKKIKQDEKTK
jgi:hypothetical protein